MNVSSTPPPSGDEPAAVVPDPREAARTVKRFLDLIDAHIVCKIRRVNWMPKDGAFPVIVASAVTRQHDGLQAIADLVISERGDAALVLLRPSVEEFIVLSYLYSIDRHDAQAFLRTLGQRDVATALQAQHDYTGASAMKDLGLDVYFDAYTHASSTQEVDAEILRLKTKLGWPSAKAPSVAFMAKKANEERRYKFLYHATSRAVHFNVGELMRRLWGKPGEIAVGHNIFEPQWALFSIQWGIHLYLDMLRLVAHNGGFGDGVDIEIDDKIAQDFLDLARGLGAMGQIPMITARELYWPFPH